MGEADEGSIKAEIDSIAEQIDAILKKIGDAIPSGREETASDGAPLQGDGSAHGTRPPSLDRN